MKRKLQILEQQFYQSLKKPRPVTEEMQLKDDSQDKTQPISSLKQSQKITPNDPQDRLYFSLDQVLKHSKRKLSRLEQEQQLFKQGKLPLLNKDPDTNTSRLNNTRFLIKQSTNGQNSPKVFSGKESPLGAELVRDECFKSPE